MLGFYSNWPFFLCLGVLLAAAATPLYRGADSPPIAEAKRVSTLDGLRGFLALAVVFHHEAIYHRWLLDGVWTGTPSLFLTLLGPVGVALFFMITGFLFWGQLIRSAGRPPWVRLYVGRVFRIGPLYLAAVAVVLSVVAVRTGFHFHEPALKVVREVTRWLSLGLLTVFGVNGYGDPGQLLAGVTWTLQWEWYFYLSLPVLALFARRPGMHLRFVLGAMLACQLYLHMLPHAPGKSKLAFAMLFLLGMLSASLRHNGTFARLPDRVSSLLVLLLFAAIFQFQNPSVSTPSQLMLGAIMYLVVSGSSIFGLLRTRAALRLGDVSYGIYLLQGLVMGAVFRVPAVRAWDAVSPTAHWLACLVGAALLTVVATGAHLWIELPGIAAGRRVASTLGRWLPL